MKPSEKRLLRCFRELDSSAQETVLDFAQFLAEKKSKQVIPTPEPVVIKAQEGETVIGAIKRLAASYPMLDRAKMLNETSVLMTQHVMHGRDRTEVIAELEVMFRHHYRLMLGEDEDGI